MTLKSSLESKQQSAHSTWIEIRLDRLVENLKQIREAASSDAEVLAVVKANAYGHGLLETAKALAPHAAYLGIASVQDALLLKEAGVRTPLFLFGRLMSQDLPSVLVNGVTLSVSSYEEAELISTLSENLFRRTPVHVKVDTGMGRMGLPYHEAQGEIEKMAALPGIFLEGIYTHLPTAESDDGFSETQLEDFSRLIQTIETQKICFRYRHATNSAGTLKTLRPFLNLIRPGIMLYGIYPDPRLRGRIEVSPVLALKSRIVLVKRLEPGQSSGYGRDFKAVSATNLAILPLGYSHGYPFRASNQGACLFHGKRFSIAGRVSMDYIAVHLGDEPAKAGEEITLIGESGGECIRAEDLAEWAGTISYEIVTRLPAQLPRIYFHFGHCEDGERKSNRTKQSPS